MEKKDNPALVFSGETKDGLTFKDAIKMRADKHGTTWLFEGERLLAEFFVCVCVFYYCRTYYKAVRVGRGGEWFLCQGEDWHQDDTHEGVEARDCQDGQ